MVTKMKTRQCSELFLHQLFHFKHSYIKQFIFVDIKELIFNSFKEEKKVTLLFRYLKKYLIHGQKLMDTSPSKP